MAKQRIHDLAGTTLAAIDGGKGKNWAWLGVSIYNGTETNLAAAQLDLANWISRYLTLTEIASIVGTQGPAGPAGSTGPAGPAGATGPAGTNGTNGVGVPAGGTTGQVLRKVDGTSFNTTWATLAGFAPPGGTAGQVLKKIDGTDYNYSWQADNTGPGGGAGDVSYPTFNWTAHGFTAADVGKPFYFDPVANAPVIYDTEDDTHYLFGVITAYVDANNFKYAPGGFSCTVVNTLITSYNRASDGVILYWDKAAGLWGENPPTASPSFITPQLLVNSFSSPNYNCTVLWLGQKVTP
jgi:hypothetical protein